MIGTNFTFKSDDGLEIFVYKWEPKDAKVKGIVQISHGMAETAQRYERFAKVLTNNGYIVYANDHRGHGKTAGSIDKLGYLGENDGFERLVNDIHKLSLIIKEENPNCGTVFTAGFFYDFMNGLKEVEDKNNFKLIPKDIPIYIFSGDKDPVGNLGKGVINLFNRYKNIGVKDIKYKLYKDGRHEMLNETNREEVMNDIIKWLDLHTDGYWR